MTKISNENQRKGILLAFAGIMFITPDSLLIRLADINSWNLIFYRGFIPFLTILIGLIFIYRSSLLKKILNNSWHGLAFVVSFAITSIVFVVSIENTNVANTLVMVALAPMLSAIISLIFLKENPDQKTWVAIVITTLAVVYIFYDAIDSGDFLGNFLGLICAFGLAVNAVIIRSAKKMSLVPSAMLGKFGTLIFFGNFFLFSSSKLHLPPSGFPSFFINIFNLILVPL